ncbi:MAG: hypothetical protein VYC71_06080, partial [Planctomycetota bacterium]|nr:hypothetical protein [Planctomycetota bacterium]
FDQSASGNGTHGRQFWICRDQMSCSSFMHSRPPMFWGDAVNLRVLLAPPVTYHEAAGNVPHLQLY